MNDVERAEHGGRTAYRMGLRRLECPYVRGALSVAWHRGWDEQSKAWRSLRVLADLRDQEQGGAA